MEARADDVHPNEGEPALLEVKDLDVTYGGVRALRGVSLRIEERSVVAVLGSNGAGKTTLLRTLSSTLRLHRGRVESGDVLFRGKSLKGMDPARCVAAGLVQVPEGRRVFSRPHRRGEPARRRAFQQDRRGRQGADPRP